MASQDHISTSSSLNGSFSHRRRRSSANFQSAPQHLNVHNANNNPPRTGSTTLAPIPGTPNPSMDHSRSTSPHEDGGWANPGLSVQYSDHSGRVSPANGFRHANGGTGWEGPRKKAVLNGGAYPTKDGFLKKHFRKFSESLPSLALLSEEDKIGIKEKPGKSRRCLPNRNSRVGRALSGLDQFYQRRKKLVLGIITCIIMWIVFWTTPLHYYWRRAPLLGGGKKYVLILAANQGGGVMEWKGPREWAIERDSVRNKARYAKRWGYDLEIVDMSTKKRYAHEWRESWEKVDAIRKAMEKYPSAEWFWWLDLNTFIMEPSYSLQSHIFNNLNKNTYRDINHYNPLNISHPFTQPYLETEELSPVGDGKAKSINMIIPQDCGGFNLGSFFIKRGAWTDRLLDVWWDPVSYEQKHMQWEHKEQDAMENLYTVQPWIRPHTAFIEQRKINSFPPDACKDNGIDEKIHYDQKGRDFLVNMAGCEWGRDCWGEMYNYRELSNMLNRNPWELFKEELITPLWFKLTGQKIRI